MPQLWYTELRAPDAAGRLRAWLGELAGQPGFLHGELLLSPDQPGLALVASRWQAAVPPVALPAGARAWIFEVQEERWGKHGATSTF